jgi:hypothetical protein
MGGHGEEIVKKGEKSGGTQGGRDEKRGRRSGMAGVASDGEEARWG